MPVLPTTFPQHHLLTKFPSPPSPHQNPLTTYPTSGPSPHLLPTTFPPHYLPLTNISSLIFPPKKTPHKYDQTTIFSLSWSFQCPFACVPLDVYVSKNLNNNRIGSRQSLPPHTHTYTQSYPKCIQEHVQMFPESYTIILGCTMLGFSPPWWEQPISYPALDSS